MYSSRRLTSWNMNGGAHLKLLSPSIRSYLRKFDVVLLQETHLLSAQEDIIPWPEDYDVFLQCRVDPLNGKRQSGGVATLVRKSLNAIKRVNLCREDMLCVILGDGSAVLNLYAPPAGSVFLPRRQEAPLEALEDAIVLLHEEGRQVFIGGDLNGHTNDRQAANGPASRLS